MLQDAYGGPLTFSGGNSDTLMLALLRAAYSGRSDTHLVASMEQALPLQPDWLNFNRFCVRAEGSMPLLKGLRAHVSGKGGASKIALPPLDMSCPAHRLGRAGSALQSESDEVGSGGVILGDLPPYEAFPIGGTNSVRGYSEGGVGSGRNYIAGTTALQWPMFGPVEVIDSSNLPGIAGLALAPEG